MLTNCHCRRRCCHWWCYIHLLVLSFFLFMIQFVVVCVLVYLSRSAWRQHLQYIYSCDFLYLSVAATMAHISMHTYMHTRSHKMYAHNILFRLMFHSSLWFLYAFAFALFLPPFSYNRFHSSSMPSLAVAAATAAAVVAVPFTAFYFGIAVDVIAPISTVCVYVLFHAKSLAHTHTTKYNMVVVELVSWINSNISLGFFLQAK